MKADVYRNLNTENKFSIKSRESHNYGKVIDHKQLVVVKDVNFVVQDSGYERYKEEGQKNVHAFVRGNLIEAYNFPCVFRSSLLDKLLHSTRIWYNPDYDNNFYNDKRSIVREADEVVLYNGTIYKPNDNYGSN
jgi:hypothetical protein